MALTGYAILVDGSDIVDTSTFVDPDVPPVNPVPDYGVNPFVSAFSIAGESGPFIVGTAYIVDTQGSFTLDSTGAWTFEADTAETWDGTFPEITYEITNDSGVLGSFTFEMVSATFTANWIANPAMHVNFGPLSGNVISPTQPVPPSAITYGAVGSQALNSPTPGWQWLPDISQFRAISPNPTYLWDPLAEIWYPDPAVPYDIYGTGELVYWTVAEITGQAGDFTGYWTPVAPPPPPEEAPPAPLYNPAEDDV